MMSPHLVNSVFIRTDFTDYELMSRLRAVSCSRARRFRAAAHIYQRVFKFWVLIYSEPLFCIVV